MNVYSILKIQLSKKFIVQIECLNQSIHVVAHI